MGYLKPNMIYTEDCRVGMAKIRSSSVDLLVTEPVYQAGPLEGTLSSIRFQKHFQHRYGIIPNKNYQDFSVEWLNQAKRAMSHIACGFIFCHWTNLRFLLNAINITGFRLVNHIIWQHPTSNHDIGLKKQFNPIHSHVLYITKLSLKEDRSRVFNRISEYSSSKGKLYFEDVWIPSYQSRSNENNQTVGYSILEKCIRIASNEGALVLDPFLASNNLLTACSRNKRKFIGFTVSDKDYEMIQNHKTLENLDSFLKNG
ncbi:MAG: DNA-methyltransferase [Candidatus Heimdallarchaeota archaeon]